MSEYIILNETKVNHNLICLNKKLVLIYTSGELSHRNLGSNIAKIINDDNNFYTYKKVTEKKHFNNLIDLVDFLYEKNWLGFLVPGFQSLSDESVLKTMKITDNEYKKLSDKKKILQYYIEYKDTPLTIYK